MTSTAEAVQIEGTTTVLKEDSRTYVYADGKYELENVVELIVRPSGSHRLRTADGKLHVVASGWLAITIVDSTTKNWTV